MGVYIKGMDMPESCGRCKMHFLSSNDYVCCSITDRIPKSVAKFKNSKTDLDFRKASIEAVNRPDWCPLVEVKTTHGDLIERDGLVTEVLRTYDYEFPTATGAFDEFATRIVPNIINNAPTIIESEEKDDG